MVRISTLPILLAMALDKVIDFNCVFGKLEGDRKRKKRLRSPSSSNDLGLCVEGLISVLPLMSGLNVPPTMSWKS